MKKLSFLIIFILLFLTGTSFAETVRGYVVDYNYSSNYRSSYNDDDYIYVTFIIKDINGNRINAYLGGERSSIEKGIQLVYRSHNYEKPFDFTFVNKGQYVDIDRIDFIPEKAENNFKDIRREYYVETDNDEDIALYNLQKSLIYTGIYETINARITKYEVTDNYFQYNITKDVVLTFDADVCDFCYKEYKACYDECIWYESLYEVHRECECRLLEKPSFMGSNDCDVSGIVWGSKNNVGNLIQKIIDYKQELTDVTISGYIYKSTINNKKYIVVDKITPADCNKIFYNY